MKNWFKNLFSQTQQKGLTVVWDSSRLSIYEFLLPHRDEGHLPESAETLPDEEIVNQNSSLKWSSGALDGVMSHHGSSKNIDQAQEVFDLLLQTIRASNRKTTQQLYNVLKEGSILEFIDPLIEKLSEQTDFPYQELYQLVYWLATESPDRAVVKFAIAILGMYSEPKQTDLFMTLGAHEEFTLYAAVAICNTLTKEEADIVLLSLAKKLKGWGKIHLVERLAQNPLPKTQDWLLREGYQNAVMYEYLAYTCATAGHLLEALTPDTIDQQLLLSTGEIIEALISGGPAEDMSDYEDGALVCSRYIDHLLQQSELKNLSIFRVVAMLRGFVEEQDNINDDEPSSLARQGWNPELKEKIKTQSSEILSREYWLVLTKDELTETDEGKFWIAADVYTKLGKDIWPVRYERQKTQKSDQWYYLMRTDDPERVKQVISLAKEHYNFSKAATGPALEMGLGPNFQIYRVLDSILQELRRFPSIGGDLIQLGLQSPVIRNRNMALNALNEWNRQDWPEGTVQTLNKVLHLEPDLGVKERIQKILDKDIVSV